MTTLDQLPIGGAARVRRVAILDAVGVRLLEMGLTPGVAVRVVGAAPLGDPLEIEVRGYRLSLRRTEARHVEVE